MPSPYNITNIPAPRVDFIDPRTGLMAREWYRFFFNLFNLTGAGTTDTSLADLQVGPPAINEVLGDLGIVYDQAQIASMMAQYEQAVLNIQNQLDAVPAASQLGTLAAVNADNVRLLGFSTNPSPPVPNPAPNGTLYWDGNNTLGLQMDQSVLAKIGQSQFTYVKASAAITKGQLCKHTGAVGGSGVITVAPTSVSMTDPNQIVGVAAEDIALNGFGFIQDSGDLRGFDTTGTSVGEVWADGDPLYYNPAYVGGLTKTKPSAPNLKSYVGEVINAGSGGSGSISIRLLPGSVLGGTDSNVQFGTLADKDLIQYDNVAKYWKNVAASAITIGTATNLSGGAAGSVPYQTAPNTTTFLGIGTASQVLKVNAGATAPEWVSGAALSKTDDTNVTLTFGGSPTTALLAATSLTLGWTGQLSLARGGTNANLTASAGSVAYSTATALALNTAGNSGDWLKSAGTAAPAWTAPAALTKTDDTNVTLTLGGSASTALLNAASITVGWTGTLAVARGGTGTGTTFTAGSVIFAGASGVYSQNNAQFFWDNTNNRLGIGTSTPRYLFDVGGCVNVSGPRSGIKQSAETSAFYGFAIQRSANDSTLGMAFNSTSDTWQISASYASTGAYKNIQFLTSDLARVTLDTSGNFLVTGVGGMGYGTGSGGAVTQGTSRTTGVTLNKTNGAITLVSAAGTTTWQTFTVTNSTVAATDTIIVNQKSGTDLYQIFVTNVAAGSFKISFATTGGTTTEQPVFNFAVIKAVTA